jgi:subtilisin family serine protease
MTTTLQFHQRRPFALVAALLAALLLLPQLSDAADGQVGPRGRMRKAALIFKSTVSNVQQAVDDLKADFPNQIGQTVLLPTLKGFVGEVFDESIDEIANDPDVASVDFDAPVEATAEQFNPPWGLDRIDDRKLPLDQSYIYSRTGLNVPVYVIDTGIRTSHAQFQGRASWGPDFVNGSKVDCNGHGTHVAGTIGGKDFGVAKQAKLVAVRVLDCEGVGTWSAVIRALDWVAGKHQGTSPAVVNLSLGGPSFEPADLAVQRVFDDKVSVVTSAGNDAEDACQTSPARAPSAITVAASTPDDARSSYSNFGTCIDLFAPGDGIRSAWRTGDSAAATLSGTSMASAHTAGVAALFLQGTPAAPPTQVRDAIWRNATAGVISDSQSTEDALLHSNFGTPPSVPRNLTAAGGNQSATLTWSPPSNSGGSPVTDYFIERAGAPRIRVPGAATSVVVSGLQNGTSYQFTVKAVTRIATGNGVATSVVPSPPVNQADLVVQSVTSSPIKPTDGGAVQFQALVKNIGTAPSPSGARHEVAFLVDGVQVSLSNSFTGPIAAGQTKLLLANVGGPAGDGLWPAVVGDHSVGAIVDPDDDFEESNINNSLTRAFPVGPNDKVAARIAYSGSTGALLVWQDSRRGTQDIFATRISTNGTVMDPEGIEIATVQNDQTEPTVAWNGKDYLVAWADRRTGGSTDIYGTLVSPTGVVATTNGKLLGQASGDQLAPSARALTASTTGAAWLLVWQDERNVDNADIYGNRVSPSGTVASLGGVPISTASNDQRRPSVASDGTMWMVAWGDRRPDDATTTIDRDSDIYAARVSANGTLLAPTGGIPVSTVERDQAQPQIAYNGTKFFVVWGDYRSGSTLDVYGSRILGTTVQDPGGTAIAANPTHREASPSVGAIGHTFLVTWQDDEAGVGQDLFASRLTDDGAVVNPGFLVSGAQGEQTLPAVGVLGANFLLAWSDTRNSASPDIYATRLTVNGAPVAPNPFPVAV